MPRRARLDAPGTLHHVMVRGIEKGRRGKKSVSQICQKRNRSREVSGVRAWIAIGLVKAHGVALAEVARRVGVSTSAISKIIKRAN